MARWSSGCGCRQRWGAEAAVRMNASTQRGLIDGPAGAIECAIDTPETDVRGVAVIAHPLPTGGGTLDNKVVGTLARLVATETAG